MATIQKTQGIELIGIQQLNANSVIKSNVHDVSTKLSASIFIHFAPIFSSLENFGNGVEFRIEASAKSEGDDQWFPLVYYRTLANRPGIFQVNGSLTSGSSLISIVEPISTAGLSVGEIIFIKNTTLHNSEWARVKSIIAISGPNASTEISMNIIDSLKNAQSGSTIYTEGEMYVSQIDLTSIGRIRVVADASLTNDNTVVEVNMVTGDSIS